MCNDGCGFGDRVAHNGYHITTLGSRMGDWSFNQRQEFANFYDLFLAYFSLLNWMQSEIIKLNVFEDADTIFVNLISLTIPFVCVSLTVRQQNV